MIIFLKKLKIFFEIFAQFKKSLYICTRNQAMAP